MTKKGFLIGKFLPPHAGHLRMFEQALTQVQALTVMIFHKQSEPIPGKLRMKWLRQLCPEITFLECTDEHRIDFEDPTVWDLWTRSIRKHYRDIPDVVFGSEPYIEELAQRLNATSFCYIDLVRDQLPISARWIRRKPWAYWAYIPKPVRPYFVQQICILGGESTGKSTLARQLALHFETQYVGEYAREFLAHNNNVCVDSKLGL